jgi:hypothetical protein
LISVLKESRTKNSPTFFGANFKLISLGWPKYWKLVAKEKLWQFSCKMHPKRTSFRVETCANKVWKNLIALVIGGCVCKNFFYFHSRGARKSDGKINAKTKRSWVRIPARPNF